MSELASRYGVHPNQISQWKKQAKEGIIATFAGKPQKAQQNDEARIKELHAKIGQLTVEKDFFCNKPSQKSKLRPVAHAQDWADGGLPKAEDESAASAT